MRKRTGTIRAVLLMLGAIFSTAGLAQSNGALAINPVAIDPEGMPPDTTRYSVWHDDQGWHLRTTSISRQHFRGALVVRGGAFRDVKPFRPAGPVPQQDLFIESPDNRSINFDFATGGGIVGVDFNVDGDKSMLQFMLEIGEDQPKFDPDKIFIGHNGAHPGANPFEFAGMLGHGNPDAIWAMRAKVSWEALVTQLGPPAPQCPECFRDGLNSFIPGTHTPAPAYAWTVSQMMGAALDVGLLTGSSQEFEQTFKQLGRHQLQKAGTIGYTPGIDPPVSEARWWDDDGWLGISLLQAHEQLHKPEYLQLVQALWPFFGAGHSPQGGERENEDLPASLRGIPSTGAVDEVAFLLYLGTPNTDLLHKQYLALASNNDQWVKRVLGNTAHLYYGSWIGDPKQSQYYDPQTGMACRPRKDTPPLPQLPPPPPNVCTWVFTSTQGLMIGSDLIAYRATEDNSYLQDAVATADATLDSYTLDWIWKQAAAVNVVFIRNLLALDAVAPHPRYREVARAYLEKIWNEGRDPETGFFTKGGIAQYATQANGLDQASITQMFAIFALPKEQLRLVH
jgi:hypothetical protein